MNSIDIIVTWPRNCDYPLWRQYIRDNRSKFNEIVIAFHHSNSVFDFSNFVRESMFSDYVHFLDAPEPKAGEDWRNLAINASLIHSYNAEWVWFTEEDFYPKDGFWEEVKRYEEKKCDVIAVYQGDRMHPCCIFAKREVLNKTKKNFGIVPNKADHFFMFQQDIEQGKYKVGVINPDTYKHYNGLSQNFYMSSIGDIPNYKREEFIDWLEQCMLVEVPHNDKFDEIAQAEIRRESSKKVANNAVNNPLDHSPTPLIEQK